MSEYTIDDFAEEDDDLEGLYLIISLFLFSIPFLIIYIYSLISDLIKKGDGND